ncbi:C3HC zinc finger-like-domain-containing protein [Flagelloscypha sp. PMI_526]|nr:C3HC zinc finger-like-domain-containing protein [Flagelloscypha sp. PMI_526]
MSDAESRVAQKRKLDQAFSKLDEAVSYQSAPPVPERPQKKPRSSFYSALFKKETPHLTAILSKKRPSSAPVSRLSSAGLSNSPAEFFPSSQPSFLKRLETFKLSTYTVGKPSAVDAAKCGWKNEGGKDRLTCSICGHGWLVSMPNGQKLGEKQKMEDKMMKALVEKHIDGCPWRKRQCDDSVYRIQLKSPAAMAKDVLRGAQTITPILHDVQIKHPLSATQLRTLTSKFSHLRARFLASLFGWTVPPILPPTPRRTSSTYSRANSVAHAIKGRYTSSSQQSFERKHTNTSPHEHNTIPALYLSEQRRHALLLLFVNVRLVYGIDVSRPVIPPRDHEAEEAPTRIRPAPKPVDLLLEHRSFCPYVVKDNTELPHPASFSLIPSSDDQATRKMEGWKAVLSMISRYRDPVDYYSSNNGSASSASGVENGSRETEIEVEMEPPEEDIIKKVIQVVKAKGGRDLLKYVKSVLP